MDRPKAYLCLVWLVGVVSAQTGQQGLTRPTPAVLVTPATNRAQLEPVILTRASLDEKVITLRLAPRVATSIRMPEPVNSVVVGDPENFQAEHSEREPELVTVKAARLIGAADVIAYHSARHGRSVARAIAEPYLRGDQAEEQLVYPVTTEATDHPGGYEGAMEEFYASAAARLMAGAHGWATGSEWTALNNIVMGQSGWQPRKNPSSEAFGITQALGHGAADGSTAGKYGNN